MTVHFDKAEEEQLQELVRAFLKPYTSITPSENAEALRMAQGLSIKESAIVTARSEETVRNKRKKIYMKVGLKGRNDLIVTLLALALEQLGVRVRDKSLAG